MDQETKTNGPTVTVDSVNQRNAPTEKDMQWRHIQSIIPRQGKRNRMEGKKVLYFFPVSAVINCCGFYDKVIIQTEDGVYMELTK